MSYFVGAHGIYAVSTNGSSGVSMAHYQAIEYSALTTLCESFRSGKAGEGHIKGAVRLHRLLMEPLVEIRGARRLWLLLDGPLEFVPFQALRRSPVSSYLIAHGPSINYVLGPPRMLGVASAARAARSLLVVADPEGNLAGANDEFRAISDAVIHSRLAVMAPPEATLKGLLAVLTAADRVHFSGHADIYRDQPNFSFLHLANRERLYSIDLAGLDFRGKRVFLAGCETEVGEIAPGDDIYGLADSFVGAGAVSVVATLWRIEDVDSVEFVRRFYSELLKVGSDSEALAATQRYFSSGRGGARFRDPSFWAAFNYLSPLSFTAPP